MELQSKHLTESRGRIDIRIRLIDTNRIRYEWRGTGGNNDGAPPFYALNMNRNRRRLNRWATFIVTDQVEDRFYLEISTYYENGEQVTPEEEYDEICDIDEIVVCKCEPALWTGPMPCRRCLNENFKNKIP